MFGNVPLGRVAAELVKVLDPFDSGPGSVVAQGAAGDYVVPVSGNPTFEGVLVLAVRLLSERNQAASPEPPTVADGVPGEVSHTPFEPGNDAVKFLALHLGKRVPLDLVREQIWDAIDDQMVVGCDLADVGPALTSLELKSPQRRGTWPSASDPMPEHFEMPLKILVIGRELVWVGQGDENRLLVPL